MLSEKQAYDAMVLFLEKFCGRTHSEDVLGLLGDIMMRDDGTTADPAAWTDWQEAVARVIAKGRK